MRGFIVIGDVSCFVGGFRMVECNVVGVVLEVIEVYMGFFYGNFCFDVFKYCFNYLCKGILGDLLVGGVF